MDITTILMNIGTWSLAIASIPQIRSIWKNRKNLRGYSKSGCLILLFGMAVVDLGFFLKGDYVSMTAGLIQIVMWSMGSIYSRTW